MQVYGSDFGGPGQSTPIVYVGDTVCGSVNRMQDSKLECQAPVSKVGRLAVVVSFEGFNSSELVFVERMCGEGFTGLPGQQCKPCPQVE